MPKLTSVRDSKQEGAVRNPSVFPPFFSSALQNSGVRISLPREKRLAEFRRALQAAEVTHIVDVRAKPYSSRRERGQGWVETPLPPLSPEEARIA